MITESAAMQRARESADRLDAYKRAWQELALVCQKHNWTDHANALERVERAEDALRWTITH